MSLDIGLVGHNIVRGDGQGRAMLELARALAGRGHRVTVHAQSLDAELAGAVRWRRLPIVPGPQLGEDVVLVPVATRQLRAAGHDVSCVLGPIAVPRAPYAYYAQFSHAGWQSTWDGARRPGLYHRLHSQTGRLLERRVARGAAVVIACAERVGAELGVPPERLRAVPNGVDPEELELVTAAERAAARQGFGLTDDDVAIAFAGEHATGRKGLDLLFAAVAAGPGDEHVLVAGRGPVERALADARRLGIEARVHLLGYRPVRHVLAAADVAAVPSRYEPFSIVAVEAAASGVPLALSARAGAADSLGPWVWLVSDPEDGRQLRAALDGARTSEGRRRAEAAVGVARSLAWTTVSQRAADAVEEAAGAQAD